MVVVVFVLFVVVFVVISAIGCDIVGISDVDSVDMCAVVIDGIDVDVGVDVDVDDNDCS